MTDFGVGRPSKAAGMVVVLGLSILTACTAGSASPVGNLSRVGSVRAADYHALAFSPTDSTTLFFGHHNGIMRSSDGGKTWSSVVDQAGFDAMNLAANPAQPEVLWMAGHNAFYKSTDAGRSWNAVPANLPGLDLHAFAVSPSSPNTLYAFAVGFGLFQSNDGGVNWDTLTFPFRANITGLGVGGNPETLYVGTDQGLTGTSDGGQTFAQLRSVSGTVPITAVAASPGSPVIYAGTQRGLARSDDGGATWSKAGLDGPVAAVALDPQKPDRVAVLDPQGVVYRSQ